MNKTQKAVDEVRTFGRGFRAMLSLVDRMEEIGNLEQFEAELKASAERLKKEQETLLSRNAQIKTDGEAAASKLSDESKTEAARVVADAKAAAEKIGAEAKANAARVTDKAEAKRVQLEEANASAEASLEALRKHQGELQAQCVDLEARIEKARAQAAKLLGS